MRVAVVARGLHEHKAKHHDTVKQHGMRARKGQAGIIGEHVGRVKEIDGSAQKPQRAEIENYYMYYEFREVLYYEA